MTPGKGQADEPASALGRASLLDGASFGGTQFADAGADPGRHLHDHQDQAGISASDGSGHGYRLGRASRRDAGGGRTVDHPGGRGGIAVRSGYRQAGCHGE